jgi:hypothetical protein
MGVGEDGYELYDNGDIELSDDMKDLILSLGSKKCQEIGITQRQWYYIREKIREGKPVQLPDIIYNKLNN